MYSIEAFYAQEENSVDLLVLGSSHAFEDVNTGTMWKNYGMAAYDLCGSIQPMWNAYYYLREALKTQTPKLVVLEAYTITRDDEYSDESRIIKNVSGMNWNRNKIDALKVSSSKDNLLGYALEYIQYHNRYADITSEDFIEYKGNEPYYKYWKGFGDNFATMEFERPVVEFSDENKTIEAKSEYYYRLIIQLCKDENLPLLIIVAPYARYNQDQYEMYNTAEQIAQEYGVSFIDFNKYYDEMGIDFKTDMADGDHLNAYGNRKFTEYLCQYICDNYDIPDRRSDDSGKYESWQKMSDYIDYNKRDVLLRRTTEVDAYINALRELYGEYKILVQVSGKYSANEQVTDFLGTYGIDCTIKDTQSWWVIDDTGECFNYQADNTGVFYRNEYGSRQLVVDTTGVYFELNKINKTYSGVNLVIVDEHNWKIADAVTITDDGVQR